MWGRGELGHVADVGEGRARCDAADRSIGEPRPLPMSHAVHTVDPSVITGTIRPSLCGEAAPADGVMDDPVAERVRCAHVAAGRSQGLANR
jgi:hypothetical protein